MERQGMVRHEDVIYHSESKGDVRIGDMNTPWLANAWRKLRTAMQSGPEDQSVEARVQATKDGEVYRALNSELLARGCALDAETKQWTFPPKPEATK